MWVTDYINTEGKKTNYSPTITATKDNKSASHVYDPDGFNSEDSFILEEYSTK